MLYIIQKLALVDLFLDALLLFLRARLLYWSSGSDLPQRIEARGLLLLDLLADASIVVLLLVVLVIPLTAIVKIFFFLAVHF